jgi:hypothetical protein
MSTRAIRFWDVKSSPHSSHFSRECGAQRTRPSSLTARSTGLKDASMTACMTGSGAGGAIICGGGPPGAPGGGIVPGPGGP